MYELDVARYGKWPSSNFGGLSKMACQGVRIRPDKFFKRPDLFSSHDLNPPIHTVLVVNFGRCDKSANRIKRFALFGLPFLH
jgi:hypothetical protein